MVREGRNKKDIARLLSVSRPTLDRWLAEDEYLDGRGWVKGKGRTYVDDTVKTRVVDLRNARTREKRYFIGSDHLRMDYAKAYPGDALPSEWFVEEVIRSEGLQTKKPKKRVKGGSKYLLYPTESIKTLGYIQQSADFIGKKYIDGQSAPVNIFSTCYHAPVRVYQIERIQAETSTCAIQSLEKLWRTYPLPNVFRIDNGLQFRGTARAPRVIGRFLVFLLNLGITPLFGSPSKPWTNPNVEGHNRVFNEKVWRANRFASPEAIDTECVRFNQESRDLFLFKYAPLMVNQASVFRTLAKDWERTERLVTRARKKICFTRFTESCEHASSATVMVMNERIDLPIQYVHQFVFVEWHLETEELLIYSEYEKTRTLIETRKFRVKEM